MILVVISLLRAIVPFSILRYPLIGAFASFLLDAFDLDFLNFFKINVFPYYQTWDKFFDTYYLTFAFIASLSWKNKLAKNMSAAFYFYRLIGVIPFLITKQRSLLFFFPNIFEFFYFYYLCYLKIFKKNPFDTRKKTIITLIILLIPKLTQEYILHFAKLEFWKWIK